MRRAGLIAAGVLALAAIVVLGSLYARREAKVRWARDIALPRVAELVELNKYPEAMALAEQVQAVLPADPKLKKLLPEMSRLVTVETTPSGATVEVKLYGSPDTAWRRLGVSPIRAFRIPFGLHLWRITAAGDEPVVRAFPSQYAPGEVTLRVSLDRVGSIPPDMVRVPGGSVGLGIPGLDHLKEVVLGDYLIDRTEVTNRQFKRFVDEGGYRRRELWKEPFVHAGKTLGWDQAMALLHDRTGRPGPATWELGDYPDGAGRSSGHRGQLVRGRGLRRLRRQAAPQRVPVEPRRRDVPDAEHRSREQLPERRHGCGRRRSGASVRTAPTTWPATPRSGAGTR